MKLIAQRVAGAHVVVKDEQVAKIGQGILALCGFGKDDTGACLEPMLEKIINLRIFSDSNGRFHYSLLDTEGELLLVPQFTLYADTTKGRRPEFFNAMPPQQAEEYFNSFLTLAQQRLPGKVFAGVFGAHMQVSLVNDGPVTISLETHG